MTFAAISTINDIELSKHGSINMCLAQHITKSNKYINYFKKSDMFTIMDNGACEERQVNVDNLHDLAELINADEIIVNDVLYDGKETINKMNKFFNDNITSKSLGYMGVAQGKNPTEWLDCFINLYKNDNITTLGLSKLSIPVCFSKITGTTNLFINRLFVIQKINKMKLTEKPIHLLGLDEPIEIAVAKKFGFIRSCDSCLPVLCGSEGISLKEKYINNLNEIRPIKKFDFNKSFNDIEKKLIKENIDVIEVLAK